MLSPPADFEDGRVSETFGDDTGYHDGRSADSADADADTERIATLAYHVYVILHLCSGRRRRGDVQWHLQHHFCAPGA